jgi:hypothetical protein
MSKKTGLVSITLPQQTYAEFSAYCKSKGYPVKRMTELVINECIKRDLYDDITLTAAMDRRIAKDKPQATPQHRRDEIDDAVEGIESGSTVEAATMYSGMVADYHRQYIEYITPVDMSGSTGMQNKMLVDDIDINELLNN